MIRGFDIDEDYYKAICEKLSRSEKIIFDAIPLSEELEKIKAEIECNMRKNNCDLYGYADSLVIIDKEIDELKGEYKPDDWDSLANAEHDH